MPNVTITQAGTVTVGSPTGPWVLRQGATAAPRLDETGWTPPVQLTPQDAQITQGTLYGVPVMARMTQRIHDLAQPDRVYGVPFTTSGGLLDDVVAVRSSLQSRMDWFRPVDTAPAPGEQVLFIAREDPAVYHLGRYLLGAGAAGVFVTAGRMEYWSDHVLCWSRPAESVEDVATRFL